MNLSQLINELESYIVKADVKVERISKRGIDWHIDHCFKVIIATSKSLINSNEDDYKWKFNFYRSLLLPLGYFPRAKVRAPKVVNNKEEIVLADLTLQLINAKSLVAEANKLNPRHNFPHPYFGLLNLKESQRFMAVHTNHHIKIIKDILSNHK